jgi:hypothetical protein
MKKNPSSERQAEIPGISLPHEQARWRWSGDPTDLKFALNTPNNLLDAQGLVSGVYFSWTSLGAGGVGNLLLRPLFVPSTAVPSQPSR